MYNVIVHHKNERIDWSSCDVIKREEYKMNEEVINGRSMTHTGFTQNAI